MITVLRNAQLFAPEECGLVSLVLGGGRVLWVGAGEPPLASGCQSSAVAEHDLRGARVIPGLVDGHAHITGGGGEAGAETKVAAPPSCAYTGAGVTSVVGMLGTDAETRSMGEVLARVRALRAEGLSAWCLTGGYHLPPATLTGSVRGDLTHIDSILGLGELALSDFRSSQPTLDELLRAAADVQVGAMLAGKPGLVHLHLGDGPRGLELLRGALDASELPARLFQPTHVNRRAELFEEALDLAVRGCTIDITAFPVTPGDGCLSAAQAVTRCLDTGLSEGSFTVSSDGGGCLPTFSAEGRLLAMEVGNAQGLLGSIAELVAQGRALPEVLPAFTSGPADLLGLASKGRLAPGHDADLVVLNGQGTALHVMACGRWHVFAGELLERDQSEADNLTPGYGEAPVRRAPEAGSAEDSAPHPASSIQ